MPSDEVTHGERSTSNLRLRAAIIPEPAPAAPVEGANPRGADRLSRGRAYLRAFGLALRERRTYDLSNAGLWLGFFLAVPIPVIALTSSGPAWVAIVSGTAPVLWAVVVGAGRQIAVAGETLWGRASRDASGERDRHAVEVAGLRQDVTEHRDERERLETHQRAVDAELALGHTIQRSLISPGFEAPGVTVAIRHVPCMHVGGDYVQAQFGSPGVLHVCIGDVSGHGVAAALVVSRIHALVQRLMLEDARPAAFLEELDGALRALVQQTWLFMTFAVLRVDLSEGVVEYATAGHPPPLLVRRGALERLSTPDRALGLEVAEDRPGWSSRQFDYADGDLLVLFTDGIFEVKRRGAGEHLGEEGIAERILSHAEHAPEALINRVFWNVAEYTGDAPFPDDVTLAVVRLGPPCNGRSAHTPPESGSVHLMAL